MVYGIRYGIPLLLLACALALSIDFVSHHWFEREVEVRAQLVARSTNDGLVQDSENKNVTHMRSVLDELTRDEKIAASAVCDSNGHIVYSTRAYPASAGCGPRA